VSEQPEQILNQPVGGADLTTELKQTKRSVSKLTLGLGAAVLVVAAFFGGVATHAAVADNPQPTAQPNNRARQFPNGGQVPSGQNGPGGGFRGGTAGTIDHVDGTDVYVKTQDGRTIKVSTSDTTQVRITQEGKLSDLKSGDTVVVQGSTGSDGTVTAQTITQGLARGQ
jgi:hypothetical protein